MESRIPRVSVIFPIYNNEKYLERCVRSVMEQTLKEIELILIDDGSVDGAPAICDRLAAEDGRIRVIHKANEGSAAGLNQGIELARGEFIAFVESDDSVEPDMYETMYERAVALNADIVKCGFYYCDRDGRHEADFFYRIAEEDEVFAAKDRPDIFLFHASIWAALYRRSFIEAHKLRFIVTPGATYSDFSWMAAVYAYAGRMAICRRAFYNYTFDNPNSSRVQEGEKCFYKPYHCLQANRILREAHVFDAVKEQIGCQEYRTCLAHARRIRRDLQGAYFQELRKLLSDLTMNGYRFSVFRPNERVTARLIVGGRERAFYRVMKVEHWLMKRMGDDSPISRLMWRLKLNRMK